MSNDVSSIIELLSRDICIVVPVFQRNYSWDISNCQMFFDDIIELINYNKDNFKNVKSHFFGTVCYLDEDSDNACWILIDGQQRFTSLSLLISAFRNFINDKEFNDNYNRCLFVQGYTAKVNGNNNIKIRLNKSDNDVYKILISNKMENIETKLDFCQKNTLLYNNYLYFYSCIKDGKNKDSNFISKVYSALRKFEVVPLCMNNYNPQQVFESLNSTGKDLSSVDKLRNYFLYNIQYHEQQDLYENYWFIIEKNVGSYISSFFIDYYRYKKNQSVSFKESAKTNIYNIYRKYFEYDINGNSYYEKTRLLFEDLKKCSVIYKKFIFDNNDLFDDNDEINQYLYFINKVMSVSGNEPKALLLYLFVLRDENRISEFELKESLKVILTYTVRLYVCQDRGLTSNNVLTILRYLRKNYYCDDFIKILWEAFNCLKNNIQYHLRTDNEFLFSLCSKTNFYSNNRIEFVKYFLYTLENISSTSLNSSKPFFSDKNITIEHIMPQKITDDWKEKLEDVELINTKDVTQYSEHLNKLGNLALTKDNSLMSNNIFDIKKDYYKNSEFYFTRNLVNYKNWKYIDINNRTELLALKAIYAWPIPKKYNISQKAVVYSLNDADSNALVNSKPSELHLSANNYLKINSWVQLFIETCQFLVNVDIGVFSKIFAKHNKVFKKSERNIDNKNMLFYLENSYCVSKNIAGVKLIDVLQEIVYSFDELAGSTYLSDIYFKI